jgi:sec-independent protein translocase protein TatA
MPLAFHFGTWEIVALVAVGLLLFGSRLPSIARSLGKSITEFKHGVKDVTAEVNEPSSPKKLEQPREVPAAKVEAKPEAAEPQKS